MKQRRVHLALGVAAVFLLIEHATAAELGFGVVGGGTYSRIPALSGVVPTGPDVATLSAKWRTGFSAGVALEYPLGQVGALRLEPRYVSQGTKFRFELRNRNSFTDDIELAYLAVPILLRSEFFKSKPVQVYLMSGVGPNFLLSADLVGIDVKDDFKSVELVLVSSAGIQGRAGGALLMMDVRIASSLTRIDKVETSGQPKAKNTSIQVVFSIIKAARN